MKNINYLIHYGVKERSGRYPFGSGDRPYQHSMTKLRAKRDVKRQLKNSKKTVSYMSNQELIDRNKRGNLENKYRKTQNENLYNEKKLVDEASNTARNLKDIRNRRNRNAYNKPIDLSKMSNQELSNAINRWNLEQNYTRMYNQRNISKGQQHINDTLDLAGDILTIGSSALGIALAIKYLKLS